MPIIVNQIKVSINGGDEQAIRKAKQLVGRQLVDKTARYSVYKVSLDARKRNDIHFVYSVFCTLGDCELEKSICEKHGFSYVEPIEINPVICKGRSDESRRITIAGFGPAGMFCALLLAENGYCPIVLERGESVDSRVKRVNSFWNGGELDENSNVQFGEGGAGTFSDGKLVTRIKDSLCRYVLKRFVDFGAPEEILSKAKPHIGTDKLREIVKGIRQRIIELGGEIRFSTRLEDFEANNNEITHCKTNNGEIDCQALVLAIGHSARDTFEMLDKKGVFIEPKPFSIGCRIEHTQEDVNYSLYGDLAANPALPVGEYQLSYRQSDGRAAYTFCMCPGGTVVAAASESGGVVTNGMSEFSRNGENANSAVAVSVSPADFGNSPLDGVKFAREIEQRAYNFTKQAYNAPSCNVGCFIRSEKQTRLETSYVKPTYQRGAEPCDLTELLPKCTIKTMQDGLAKFSRQMSCFSRQNAILTAPETRTSSPVRITRNEELTSISIKNLYPAGEGAGYAGGITSAAVDGLKCALKLMERYPPIK